MRHLLTIPLLLCLSLASAWSQESPATQAELISEARTIAAGGTFTAALKLRHPDGWHSYYRNSGGIEQSPSIQWTLPEGFSAGPIHWTLPAVKEGLFGKSFIHTGSPVFLVDIKAPAGLEAGKSINLGAKASWQICEQSCINESASFTLTLPVGAALETDPQVADVLFAGQLKFGEVLELHADRFGAEIEKAAEAIAVLSRMAYDNGATHITIDTEKVG